jgi:hypothetical protein
MGATGKRAASGFTIVEVAVVASVFSALTLLIVQALADLSRSQAFTRGQARIAETADRVMRGLVNDLTFSVRLFADGQAADDYLAALAYPRSVVTADARLPALTDKGFFEPDPAGKLETGNQLFLARYVSPVVVTIPKGTTTQPMRIDTLGFIVYYLRAGNDGNLDLERWGSVPLARQDDILMVPVTERQNALQQLYAAGVRYAWDTNAPAATGLFEISSSGAMDLLPSTRKVAGDPAQIQTSIVGSRHMAVAKNGKTGRYHVPGYAAPGALGFPGGFEVKIDGPPSGKLVLLRLLLRSGSGGSTDNFVEIVRMVSCRDG